MVWVIYKISGIIFVYISELPLAIPHIFIRFAHEYTSATLELDMEFLPKLHNIDFNAKYRPKTFRLWSLPYIFGSSGKASGFSKDLTEKSLTFPKILGICSACDGKCFWHFPSILGKTFGFSVRNSVIC